MEKALKDKHREPGYEDSKSFAQNDAERLARFAVALARSNRNIVFHCHGRLPNKNEHRPRAADFELESSKPRTHR